MPNIIEQQDLLKGLPDNRLAMMMQNPSGDIPPFLVAAEAQRRQAIRAQFSGGPQESVVDTLTKQMANVPQNIQAPAQMPPRMPPPQMQQQMPPQAGGVAALQQGMRDGGMVQRYQALGLVTPLQTRVQDVADQFGVTVEQAAEMIKNNPSLSGTRPPSEYGTSLPITEENRETKATPSFPDLPAINISPADYAIKQREAVREAKYQEMDSYPGYSGPSASLGSSAGYDPLSSIRTKTASPAKDPRDPEAGQDDTSEANRMSAREAELRKRQEELFGDSDPSSWEKAQKWFAAAQAAVQPGQTNAQAAINALAALGGGFAEEKAAQRQSESEKEKAMLQWDLARYEADRAAAAKAAEDRKDERVGAYKFYAEQAGGSLKEAGDMLDSLERRRAEYIKNLPETLPGAPPPDYSKDPYIASLDKQIQQVQDMIISAQASKQRALSGYGSATGTDPSVTVFTGEGLATYNRQ